MEEDDLVPGGDRRVAEDDVDHGRASEVHDRGHVTEHLLDGGGEDAAVVQQAAPLGRVLEEGVHGSRHEVAGRLVPRDREQEEEQLELQLAELLAVDLYRGQHAHEVFVGVDPLHREELGRVGVELHRRLLGEVCLVLVLGVLVAHHAVGPVEHAVPVGLGHAEELGDDLEGKFRRDVRHEVGAPRLNDPVDDGVRRAVDARLEIAHHARGEPLVDQPPVARVERRVHVQHHQALLGDLLLAELEGHHALGARTETLVVAVHRDAVSVTGHGPETGPAGLVLPVHRIVASQVGQPGMGHARDEGPGVGQVDGGQVSQGAHAWTAPLRNRTGCPIFEILRPDQARGQPVWRLERDTGSPI